MIVIQSEIKQTLLLCHCAVLFLLIFPISFVRTYATVRPDTVPTSSIKPGQLNIWTGYQENVHGLSSSCSRCSEAAGIDVYYQTVMSSQTSTTDSDIGYTIGTQIMNVTKHYGRIWWQQLFVMASDSDGYHMTWLPCSDDYQDWWSQRKMAMNVSVTMRL